MMTTESVSRNPPEYSNVDLDELDSKILGQLWHSILRTLPQSVPEFVLLQRVKIDNSSPMFFY